MRNLLARIAAALRSTLGGLSTAWSWLSEDVLVGAVGYAWSAAKAPFQVAAAAVGVDAFSPRDRERLKTLAVGASAGAVAVGKAVSFTGRLAGAAVGDVMALPGQIVSTLTRGLGGGGGGGQSEQGAASEAAARTRAAAEAADAAAHGRELVQAVRRVASAVKRGTPLPEDALALLDKNQVEYLKRLTPEEAGKVAVSQKSAIQDLLLRGVPPRGVRPPEQVHSDCRASSAKRTATRAPRAANDHDADEYLVAAYA